jgi:hypothetical protein
MIGPLVAALLATASPLAVARHDTPCAVGMLPFSTMMFPLAQQTGVDYISGENAGNTFSSASENAVTISGATLKPSTDYLLIGSFEMVSWSSTFNASMTVLNGATVLNTQDPTIHSAGSGDAPVALSYVCKVTTSSSPANDNWILRVNGDGVNNYTYRNARLILIRLTSNDAYAHNHARQTWASPTSATAQTAVSLSFTPATPGRYLLLGFLLSDVGNSTTNVVSMDGAGYNTGEQPIYNVSGAAERIPSPLMIDATLAATPQTFNLKIRADAGTGTLGATDACIVAIRLDRFPNVYGSARSSASSVFSSSLYYTTPAWTTFTPNHADHLTLAIGHFRQAPVNVGSIKLNDNGTAILNPSTRSNYSGYNDTFLVARIANYTATERNVKIEHTGTNMTTDCPSVIILDLGSGTATSSSVKVRGHAIASSSGSTLTLSLPSGCQPGDLMFVFTGHGFAVTDINLRDSWCEVFSGTNWNGGYCLREITAADITAGSITFTYSGSFNGVRAAVVFAGMPQKIVAFESSRNSSGATSRSISVGADCSPRVGDYVIAFGSGRAATSVTADVGSQLRQVNGTNASGCLYGGRLTADGGFTTTFNYGSAPSGDYQVVVVVSGSANVDSNTMFLTRFDTTTPVDLMSGANGTLVGNANCDTTNKKLVLDGVGDYCSFGGGSPFNLGIGGSGTLELHTDLAAAQVGGLVSRSGSGTSRYALYCNGAGNVAFYADGFSAGTPLLNYTFLDGLPHHIAIVRNGSGANNWSMYVDGILRAQNTWAGAPTASLNPFYIGNDVADLANRDVAGGIWRVKISNSARYTANFTPPAVTDL